MLSIFCPESLAWFPALRAKKLLAIRLGGLTPSKVVWVVGDFETPVKMLVSNGMCTIGRFSLKRENAILTCAAPQDPLFTTDSRYPGRRKCCRNRTTFGVRSARLPEMAN